MNDRIIPFDPGRRRTRRAESGPPARRRPPVPRVPDFARADVTWLQPRDIDFLLGVHGYDTDDETLLTEGLPPALESLIEHDAVYARVAGERGGWLDISPHLYFHVMLRRRLPAPHNYVQRRVIRYLANLLSLFVRTERLYRIQPGESESFEYLVDLLAEAAESDHERQFLVHAHLGNYALYLTGIGHDWIEYRRKYGRSTLDVNYYRDMGRRAFKQAAEHRLSRELRLTPVFETLCDQFAGYACALRTIGVNNDPSGGLQT